jgi:dihydroorotate dehydrogenase electron transfer subunit
MVFYRVEWGNDYVEPEFIYRVMGRGTAKLAELRRSDAVDLLGPLGNGYTIDEAIGPGQEVALVSGGVGVPALYLLVPQLQARGINLRLFHGDRTSDPDRALLCIGDFHQMLDGDRIICATEDGSFGERGFVTVPLEKALRDGAFRPAALYACGPYPMMKRVAEIAAEFEVPAQVSLEAQMGCGFGVCIACAERVRVDGQEKYVRVCLEGPVFAADQVVWH